MALSWDEEVVLIEAAALRFGVDPIFIQTIRKVENGTSDDPDLEFGVMKERGNGYAAQLRATCETVRNRLMVYNSDNPFFEYMGGASVDRRLGYSRQFIMQFASYWAPVGALNDPAHLNGFWAENAIKVYQKLIREMD